MTLLRCGPGEWICMYCPLSWLQCDCTETSFTSTLTPAHGSVLCTWSHVWGSDPTRCPLCVPVGVRGGGVAAARLIQKRMQVVGFPGCYVRIRLCGRYIQLGYVTAAAPDGEAPPMFSRSCCCRADCLSWIGLAAIV